LNLRCTSTSQSTKMARIFSLMSACANGVYQGACEALLAAGIVS
jgi:hypothetical protein